ncbi:MAG: hypothetical protein EXQ56_02410 [Acidobacteria bacterium]|nr:hypothetical protein [Acidobacteriota bacterium]
MELNEQNLRQLLVEQRDEYQRYLEVFAEDLGSKVQAVGEGHQVVRQEMAEGFRDAKLDMEQVRFEMELVRSELSIIRNDLKQKVDRDELAVLEAGVAKLEHEVRTR